MASNSAGGLHLLRLVLLEARAYWFGLAGLLLLGILAMPVALLLPLPSKIVVDNVLGQQPLPAVMAPFAPAWAASTPEGTLWYAIVPLIMIAVLGLLQRFGSWWLANYLGEKIVLEFRSKLFDRVTR